MARTLETLQKQYSRAAAAVRGRGPMAATNSFKGKPANMGPTLKRLFAYVGRYWKRLILVALCMLLSTAGTLAGSYLLRPIINHIADAAVPAAQRVTYLAHMLAVLAGVYVIGIAGSYLQSRLMIGVSRTAIQNIRNDLFTRLERLPLSFHDNQSTGELMSRFTNDVDNIGLMMDQSMMSLFSGIINLAGTLVMMIVTNIWLTLVTLFFIPLFALASRLIIAKSRRYYAAQQAALGAVNGYIEESVSGQRVVKVFNHEKDCEAEFDLLNGDLRGKQMNSMFYGGIMGPVTGNLAQVSYALTAGIGGALCALGRFDVGGLAIFVNYSRQFARPINEISQQMATIFSALAGAERVFAIMDMEPEAPDDKDCARPERLEGHVVLQDVSFGYVPGKIVLQDISLYARPGQKIAFVGSTGAGKTTVTNLLNRFYDIEAGVVTIDGIDIKKLPRDFLRQNIAMVLQDTHLFTGTVMENIRYGRLDATDDEVVAAAKMASADSFIRRLSEGYQTVIEGDGANLSQGQRQLLNIARAALSHAPILVLDEATSSVDTRTERHIEQGMDRLMRDRTTFIIAHRLSTVRNANAIMVLENGRIIERGSHDDLLALRGRYYELYTGKSELA